MGNSGEGEEKHWAVGIADEVWEKHWTVGILEEECWENHWTTGISDEGMQKHCSMGISVYRDWEYETHNMKLKILKELTKCKKKKKASPPRPW